jgi:site-specific recombinase XerD
VHATRHTWALTMHDKGATLQQIGKGLGYSNLKTTSDYLEEQPGYENPFAEQLAEEFGI